MNNFPPLSIAIAEVYDEAVNYRTIKISNEELDRVIHFIKTSLNTIRQSYREVIVVMPTYLEMYISQHRSFSIDHYSLEIDLRESVDNEVIITIKNANWKKFTPYKTTISAINEDISIDDQSFESYIVNSFMLQTFSSKHSNSAIVLDTDQCNVIRNKLSDILKCAKINELHYTSNQILDDFQQKMRVKSKKHIDEFTQRFPNGVCTYNERGDRISVNVLIKNMLRELLTAQRVDLEKSYESKIQAIKARALEIINEGTQPTCIHEYTDSKYCDSKGECDWCVDKALDELD